tara:strand:- start:139 stop:900 length:762 start_codon:yes stop_codon:yes gene_type:complete
MPRLNDITGNWFPDPFLLANAVGSGGVPNMITIDKFGHNSAVSNTGTPEDIWEDGGNLVFLTSAETMSIESTDAGDDKDGTTGSKNIIVQGLDNDFNEIEETIDLEGLTPVTTVNSFIRINRLCCDDVGSSGVNLGKITATATTAGTIQASVSIGDGQTEKTQFTVPNGKTGYITNMWVGVGKGDDATIKLFVRKYEKSWRLRRHIDIFESDVDFPFHSYIICDAKSDVRMTSLSGINNGIAVSAGYDMYILG